MVRLNRRNSAPFPTGIYHCDIPVDQGCESLYIGVYNTDQGNKLLLTSQLLINLMIQEPPT